MGYGATDEPVAEEMQGMTDDEADVKSRKKKGKGGMKPGQALSFSGLEKRSHTGGDMLDMQVMLPRVIGGCCAMFVTIVLVACWIVHIIQGSSAGKAAEARLDSQEAGGTPTIPAHAHAAKMHHLHRSAADHQHALAHADRGRK